MMEQKKTPRGVDQDGAPEPERMTTPEEEAGMDLAELQEPPQAEGPRDRGTAEREDESEWRDRRKNEGAD